MMGGANTGQLSVPPGFRFHPTDEELLHYYLRKKVSYEAIDLDVIREVDLNKLEPWDLKDKCRIGSGCQNEWYFFSHKDKKYPTGTRTNRATMAGFWKATGRDKGIHLSSNSKRIGLRKTLVFYTGRAPHGQKTDWIMHEYRLDDDSAADHLVQEDGWVVCRVFKKKNHNRSAGGFQTEAAGQEEEEEYNYLRSSHVHHVHNVREGSGANSGCGPIMLEPKQNVQAATQLYEYNFDGSMHLPQLLSPAESAVAVPPPSFISPLLSLNNMDIECSQNLLRLTSTHHHGGCGLINNIQLEMRMNNNTNINGDWSFLDKLLQASHNHNQDHHSQTKCHHPSSSQGVNHVGTSAVEKFPFQYLGCETEILKFSK